MKTTIPKPPEGIGREAKRLWDSLLDAYEFDTAALAILEAGISAFDEMKRCERRIRKEGSVLNSPHGRKANPRVSICKDARNQFLLAFKHLGLPIDDSKRPQGRPPAPMAAMYQRFHQQGENNGDT